MLIVAIELRQGSKQYDTGKRKEKITFKKENQNLKIQLGYATQPILLSC